MKDFNRLLNGIGLWLFIINLMLVMELVYEHIMGKPIDTWLQVALVAFWTIFSFTRKIN